MTREEAISLLSQVNHILVNSNSWLENTHEPLNIAFNMAIKALEQEPTIKALGEELRKARKGIADEKVLIGYNMAIAICNKHLGESEDKE